MKILITVGAGVVDYSFSINLNEKYPSNTNIAFNNLKRRCFEFNLNDLTDLNIQFFHEEIRNSKDLNCIEDFKNK
jgi:hypothetical protein